MAAGGSAGIGGEGARASGTGGAQTPSGQSGGSGGVGSPDAGGASAGTSGSGTAGGPSPAAGGVGGVAGAQGNLGSGGIGGSGGRGGAGGSGSVSLFDGTTLSGWLQSSIASPYSSKDPYGNAPGTWNVQDNALHCLGKVRGVLVSPKDYGSFRLIFWVRQLPFDTTDHHYASVLIWGRRTLPQPDAIAGIQMGNPNGYYWDYRPGAKNPSPFFSTVGSGVSRTEWAQCEILANHTTGVVMEACCNPGTATSCKAKEVLKFNDPKHQQGCSGAHRASGAQRGRSRRIQEHHYRREPHRRRTHHHPVNL